MTIWFVVALVLIDIGLFFKNHEDELVLESQMKFLSAVFLGLVIGLLLWYINYKPLRDDALRMIAEIEGE